MQELNGLPKIPPTWSWSTINDACLKVQDGTHFSPQNQLAQGAYKYITAKNVRPSGLDLSNVSYLAEDEHRAIYKRCDPKKGDVLLVKDGVNTGDAAVNTLDEEFSLLSSVCLLRPRPALLYSQFLRYYLLSPVGYRMLTGQMTGTAIKRIILGRIKGSPVPIAPLDEQRDIVAEIEKQFSRLDEAIANLKRVKANLKRYKAAVLKAAVEGKLTEDWRKQHPDVEPANKLLERILAERRAKWRGKGKYKEPAVPSSANLLPFPPGWCWATLDQTLWQLRSGTAETSKRELTEYPVLKSSAVRQGTIDFSDLNYLQKLQSMRPENFLKLGDFLITRLSGSVDYVGCSAVVKSSLCEGIQYPDRIFCGKLLTGINGTYLSYCFQHPMIRKILEGAAKSTAGHQRISMSDLYPLALPLPPTAEQVRIVAEVERRLSVIDELGSTAQANLTRADRLRQSILSQAFAGNLVCVNANREGRQSDDIKVARA